MRTRPLFTRLLSDPSTANALAYGALPCTPPGRIARSCALGQASPADQPYPILPTSLQLLTFLPYTCRHLPSSPNTGFSSDLHDAGCCNVSSIDLSSVVIQQMADRYRDKEEMEFTVMDATNLDFFPNECFDLVIDKGLTDAVLCGDKSFERVSSMISEMHRVLKRGGTYIVCSYGVPASRVTYLKKDAEWLDVEIKQIGTNTRVCGTKIVRCKWHRERWHDTMPVVVVACDECGLQCQCVRVCVGVWTRDGIAAWHRIIGIAMAIAAWPSQHGIVVEIGCFRN